MKAHASPIPPLIQEPKSGKRPVTLYMAGDLISTGMAYSAACPNIRNISSLLERLLARHLKQKAAAKGIALPASLAIKAAH